MMARSLHSWAVPRDCGVRLDDLARRPGRGWSLPVPPKVRADPDDAKLTECQQHLARKPRLSSAAFIPVGRCKLLARGKAGANRAAGGWWHASPKFPSHRRESRATRWHAGTLCSYTGDNYKCTSTLWGALLTRAPAVVFRSAVVAQIKLALQAGKANPAPPVGPALGSKVRCIRVAVQLRSTLTELCVNCARA